MNFRVLLFAGWVCVLLLVSPLSGYTTYGTKWTTSPVTMQLQLGTTSTTLFDGFTSWNASAEDALLTWNTYITSTKFAVVSDSTVNRASGNGLNNVYFSGDVNGQA